MSNEQEMREAFEKDIGPIGDFTRDGEGYFFNFENESWKEWKKEWKASRAALTEHKENHG